MRGLGRSPREHGVARSVAMNPDWWIQEAIRVIFRFFDRLGRTRQVVRHMRREGLTAPCPMDTWTALVRDHHVAARPTERW
jgi:hypothetical protein